MGVSKILIFSFLLQYPFMLAFCDSQCNQTFNCKNLGSLEYPLTDHRHPDCGLITVDCDTPTTPQIQLGDNGQRYDVIEVISVDKYKIRDPVIQSHLNARNCYFFRNVSLPKSSFISFSITSPNLTLFICQKLLPDNGSIIDYFKNFESYTNCMTFTAYYKYPAAGNSTTFDRLPDGCSMAQVPMNPAGNSSDVFRLLSSEFNIEWRLHKQGKDESKRILIAVGVSVTVLAALCIALFVFIRKKNLLIKLLGLEGAETEKQMEIENFLKNNENLAPKRYKYSHLKKITDSFTEVVGKGGYGCVYKGKLQDGRIVAVKMLNESKGNGEEFMNEVASISRTSHVSIVSLLGFCFEGSKRALIYEFMPNGSLDKFMHCTEENRLGCEKLFEIAVGIAQGLEYLHQGCSTRILHFDIKPHNILLDKDLKPKISDFGLSKLCPNRSSIVSLLAARGTIGYIAPEVFCRNFGDVSHKSDVYSYGMMVLEMVVGKKTIESQSNASTEMYFPDWIYKNLEQDDAKKGVDSSNITEDDGTELLKKKLITIGLWCIQTEPRNRPSIIQVIEMLEGKPKSLEVPPRSYLYSRPRSPLNISDSDLTM